MSAGVPELVRALIEFRDQWGCDQVSAAYVAPSGVLVTVTISGQIATVGDDDGNLMALPLGELGL